MNKIQKAYLAGKTAAEQKFAASPGGATGFAPVPPPPAPRAPTPEKRTTASQPSAPTQPAPGTPKPATPMAAPPGSPQAISQTLSSLGMQQAFVNPAMKTGEFNKEMHAKSKPEPGEIVPDNATQILGDNFSDNKNRDVSKGFDNLVVQKNQDLLNAGNEASIGAPGV